MAPTQPDGPICRRKYFSIKKYSYQMVNVIFLFRYLGKAPFNLFQEREDPAVVYCQLRTRLKQCILSEFYLEDGIKILKRLHDAYPDTLVVTKAYTEKIRLNLMMQRDNFKYTRLQGLKDLSKSLGLQHQHDFDSELSHQEDCYQLREPFSRDLRRKLMEAQKYLGGNEKYMKLGNLKPAKFELCGWYATGAVPKPTLAPPSSGDKTGKNFQTGSSSAVKPEKRRRSRTTTAVEPKKVKSSKPKSKTDKVATASVDKPKKPTKGEKKLTTAKLKELEQFKQKMAQVTSV